MISADTLPDDILLAIFYHYVNDEDQSEKQSERAWQSLVHVCRRWRSIIFASPRHLNLQLVCTSQTPAKDMLEVWPAFPLIIQSYIIHREGRMDNIIAVLERSVRVSQIRITNIHSSDLKIFLEEMQRPFPELTDLYLHSFSETVPVVPDSFLGGSTPRLQNLVLSRIPFPGLPKLLLSAAHLVTLSLDHISHSGYITPDVMVTVLSSLTSLSSFTLEFQPIQPYPDHAGRRPLPLTRSVLPVLTFFIFEGASKYIEDLVARIDAPRLNFLRTTFFNDTVIATQQFVQFISRTPTSRAPKKAQFILQNRHACLRFLLQTPGDGVLNLGISCRRLDLQLSSLKRLCTSCFPCLSILEDLYIYEDPESVPDWKDDIENGLWLQLLHLFTAVRNLFLSEQIALRIGHQQTCKKLSGTCTSLHKLVQACTSCESL